MATYRITVTEHVAYQVYVDAKDECEAGAMVASQRDDGTLILSAGEVSRTDIDTLGTRVYLAAKGVS